MICKVPKVSADRLFLPEALLVHFHQLATAGVLYTPQAKVESIVDRS